MTGDGTRLNCWRVEISIGIHFKFDSHLAQIPKSSHSDFFFFNSHTCSIWKFLDQGSNHNCSCKLMPQPGNAQIQATSVTYSAACGNARTLTPWARPRIKPKSGRLHWVLNLLSYNRNSHTVIFKLSSLLSPFIFLLIHSLQFATSFGQIFYYDCPNIILLCRKMYAFISLIKLTQNPKFCEWISKLPIICLSYPAKLAISEQCISISSSSFLPLLWTCIPAYTTSSLYILSSLLQNPQFCFSNFDRSFKA